MSRLVKLSTILVVAIGLMITGAASTMAQSAIEELAVQQIANETGIDERELATLFVSDGVDQFILAFVYISEATLESDLKPELKVAVAPYVGRNAMLTLVVPTRRSNFNPTEIAFVQDNVTHLLAINQIHAISDDFLSGQLPAQSVSSGIIELPVSLNFDAQFDIVFRGSFITPFFIGNEVVVEESSQQQQQQSGGIFGNALIAFLQILLTLLLIPFLIII